jgi:hypothetical protein
MSVNILNKSQKSQHTSAKIKGVCINQICVNLNKIAIKSCPDDQNGTVCSGKGVCFNCDIL